MLALVLTWQVMSKNWSCLFLMKLIWCSLMDVQLMLDLLHRFGPPSLLLLSSIRRSSVFFMFDYRYFVLQFVWVRNWIRLFREWLDRIIADVAQIDHQNVLPGLVSLCLPWNSLVHAKSRQLEWAFSMLALLLNILFYLDLLVLIILNIFVITLMNLHEV